MESTNNTFTAEAHPLTAALAARPPSVPALRGPLTRWMAPVEVRLATTVLLQRGSEIVARQADIVGIPELTAGLDGSPSFPCSHGSPANDMRIIVKQPSPPMVLV